MMMIYTLLSYYYLNAWFVGYIVFFFTVSVVYIVFFFVCYRVYVLLLIMDNKRWNNLPSIV